MNKFFYLLLALIFLQTHPLEAQSYKALPVLSNRPQVRGQRMAPRVKRKLKKTEAPQILEQEKTSFFKLLASVDLNVVNVDTFDTGYSYMLGAQGIYFLSEYVGIHSGLQYSALKGSEQLSKTDFTVNYLDIPFGMTFSYNPVNVISIENFINLGVFLGVPLSKAKFKTSGVGSYERDAGLYYGVNLESYTVFPVSGAFALGLHTFLKYGLTNIIEKGKNSGDSSRYFASGLGLAAKFM